MTRAKIRVFLLYSINRRRLGSDEFLGMPSRFLNEIPNEYLERIEFQSALTRRVIVGKRTRKLKLQLQGQSLHLMTLR